MLVPASGSERGWEEPDALDGVPPAATREGG